MKQQQQKKSKAEVSNSSTSSADDSDDVHVSTEELLKRFVSWQESDRYLF